MSKEDNIEVFETTKYLYENTPELIEAINYSNKHQQIILETDAFKTNLVAKTPGQIIVSQKKSFEAAQHYANLGKKVAVLNFASATNPGGGVLKGSSAQEECLCRTSTLYPCLNTKINWDSFYFPHRDANNPLNNDDIIYTPNVIVFREDTDEAFCLSEENWYEINVITCAAPNLRDNPSNRYNPKNGSKVTINDTDLYQLHVKRFERIFEVVASMGNDVIILGAFGCGAFLNPPEVVARAANILAHKYRIYFDTIEFAIYCGRDMTNFRVFNSLINN